MDTMHNIAKINNRDSLGLILSYQVINYHLLKFAFYFLRIFSDITLLEFILSFLITHKLLLLLVNQQYLQLFYPKLEI